MLQDKASFLHILCHRKLRGWESVLCTNDIMCCALSRLKSSLSYQFSIFEYVRGWQPCVLAKVAEPPHCLCVMSVVPTTSWDPKSGDSLFCFTPSNISDHLPSTPLVMTSTIQLIPQVLICKRLMSLYDVLHEIQTIKISYCNIIIVMMK